MVGEKNYKAYWISEPLIVIGTSLKKLATRKNFGLLKVVMEILHWQWLKKRFYCHYGLQGNLLKVAQMYGKTISQYFSAWISL